MDQTTLAYNAIMDSFTKHLSLAQQHRLALSTARTGKSIPSSATNPSNRIQRRCTANTHRAPAPAPAAAQQPHHDQRPLSWQPAPSHRYSFEDAAIIPLDSSTLAPATAEPSNLNGYPRPIYDTWDPPMLSLYPQPSLRQEAIPLPHSHNLYDDFHPPLNLPTQSHSGMLQSTFDLNNAQDHNQPIAQLERELVGISLYDNRPHSRPLTLLTSAVTLGPPAQPACSPAWSTPSSATSAFVSPASQHTHHTPAFDFGFPITNAANPAFDPFHHLYPSYPYPDLYHEPALVQQDWNGTAANGTGYHIPNDNAKIPATWLANWPLGGATLPAWAYPQNDMSDHDTWPHLSSNDNYNNNNNNNNSNFIHGTRF